MASGGLLPVSESLQTILNGLTLGVGYKIYTYETDTSTPLATYPTYDDAVAQTNANANPTVADSNGRVAMWGSGATAYKVVVKTAADVTVKTINDCHIIPGATILQSKTPSEYQIALYENVAGSYKLTNSQTEDTYDFKYASTGITLGSNKKFFFRDTAIYLHSPSDGQADLVADSVIQVTAPTINIEAATALTLESDAISIGKGAADSIALTFNGNLNETIGVRTKAGENNAFEFSSCLAIAIAAGAPTTVAATHGYIYMTNATPCYPRFRDNNAGTDYYFTITDGTTGGSASAGAGNQYVELNVNGTTYKVLHDGTV